MIYLDLSNKNLSSLSEYIIPTTVTRLDISNNNFVNLTTVPFHIEYLFVDNNQTLVSLEGCPTQLKYLYAPNCSLTNLDYLSTETQECVVNNNSISNIDRLTVCNKLIKLNIDNNLITSIDNVIYAIEISANNNHITYINADLNVNILSIKRNPISSITIPNIKLGLLNITNTNIDISDINIPPDSKVKIIKENYSNTNLSTMPYVYDINNGTELYDVSTGYNKSSYINVFYIHPYLYFTPPIFMTIDTSPTWTIFDFTNFYKDVSDFRVSGGTITYLGSVKKLFMINNQIVVSGQTDFMQIIGIKNMTETTTIDYTNSMIVSSPINNQQVSFALIANFFLNTGDTVSFHLRTGTNNTITIYTLSLMIINI